ncbi:MAG: Fe-S cluster assembly protein SufD [Woeseia sp.]
MSASSINTELLERAVGKLPSDLLMPQRMRALTRFAESGFPTTRHEDWRYTNLAPAIDLSNLWLLEAADGAADEPRSDASRHYAAELASTVDAHWIVIANGVVQKDLLTRLTAQQLPGLEAVSVAAGNVVQPVFSILAEEPMTRFNTALLRDALHISIGAGHEPDKPLGLLVIDDASSGSAVSQTRIILDVATNARAEVIEYHASIGSHGHFANVVTELKLAQDAAVDYVRIQNRDRAHFQVGKLITRLGRNASMRHAAFDLGGALVRNDVAVDIAEPRASIELHGLYLADGKQHIDNHTRVDHRVGPAKSREEYRGILSDRARCVWNGKAIVHAGADGTDAHQANYNLLLSDKAEIDTKPELEIYADDVKCSHGATVGQLDKAALFYLRSRGLERDEAAQVLTRAFAAAIVAKSTVDNVRGHVETLIDRRLQDLVGGASR